jgi:hypothetical protein
LLAFIASGCSGGTANDTTALPTAIVMTQPPPTTVTRPTIPPATPSVAPSIPPATTRPTNPPTAGKPLRLDNLEFGVVSHLYYTDRERVLTLTNIAGFDWVRQQIQWKDIEGPPNDYKWGELDNIVNEVVARKLKLLISITKAPSFYNETNGLPNDPKAMGNFVEALVKRYGNKITAIEIWNEQNLATENGGRVTVDDAGKYVEILVESYNRIKAVAPEIYVLAGAPSSSGVNQPELAVSDENYFKAMYTYKDGLIKDHFDAQAVHPGGAANSPDWLYPEEPGDAEGWNDHPTHYFRHIENVRQFMVENGVGDRQIWITEFGWATPNDTPGYEFGNQVSLEKQADYVVSAVNRTYKEYRDDQGQPWVGVMFLWNMNFAVLWGAQGNPDHEQASFGILGPDWSPRPAFTALQGLLPQIKQDQGR